MPPESDRGYRAVIRFRARDWDRTAAPLHAFGGHPILGAELPRSRASGHQFHLAFDLDLSDPRLRGLGIRSVRRLAVLASYHLDDWPQPLVVRHLEGGRRLEVLVEPRAATVHVVPDVLPQLPVDLSELTEAEAGADRVADHPEGHGPLHQVGGRPVWVTRPIAAPRCPVTGRPMRFVACVDTIERFPLSEGETRLAFSDCGALYVFWSDAAAISAAVVQSA